MSQQHRATRPQEQPGSEELDKRDPGEDVLLDEREETFLDYLIKKAIEECRKQSSKA